MTSPYPTEVVSSSDRVVTTFIHVTHYNIMSVSTNVNNKTNISGKRNIIQSGQITLFSVRLAASREICQLPGKFSFSLARFAVRRHPVKVVYFIVDNSTIVRQKISCNFIWTFTAVVLVIVSYYSITFLTMTFPLIRSIYVTCVCLYTVFPWTIVCYRVSRLHRWDDGRYSVTSSASVRLKSLWKL